jgi:hypothetical protein
MLNTPVLATTSKQIPSDAKIKNAIESKNTLVLAGSREKNLILELAKFSPVRFGSSVFIFLLYFFV